jgi:hypothetical protein
MEEDIKHREPLIPRLIKFPKIREAAFSAEAVKEVRSWNGLAVNPAPRTMPISVHPVWMRTAPRPPLSKSLKNFLKSLFWAAVGTGFLVATMIALMHGIVLFG